MPLASPSSLFSASLSGTKSAAAPFLPRSIGLVDDGDGHLDLVDRTTIQIGPFANKKEADAMRQRLQTDGYNNAIVK